jgi:shikimate dehydrogenase
VTAPTQTLASLVAFDDLSNTYISLAAKPGRFGSTVHSAGFAALQLPYRYVALSCSNIQRDIALVRQHGVPGASITMPFKREVMPWLDRVTDDAADIGSVNTVVNRDGFLIGHNTDVDGARMALSDIDPSDTVVILGGGAMSRTFIHAIPANNPVMVLTRRDQTLDYDMPCATIVINATPMGMSGVPEIPALLDRFPACRKYVESVVGNTTTLDEARGRGIAVVTGVEIAFEQAFSQFLLYTGLQPPRDAMRAAIIEMENPNV